MNNKTLHYCSDCTWTGSYGCQYATADNASKVNYASKVNTLIGTDYTGNTYPGAQAPFGMVQLSPDNGLPNYGLYSRLLLSGQHDCRILPHTHLSGTGAGDLYDISFLPVTLPLNDAPAPLGIHSKFTSHDEETAHAGYYQVRLTDYDINVELYRNAEMWSSALYVSKERTPTYGYP